MIRKDRFWFLCLHWQSHLRHYMFPGCPSIRTKFNNNKSTHARTHHFQTKSLSCWQETFYQNNLSLWRRISFNYHLFFQLQWKKRENNLILSIWCNLIEKTKPESLSVGTKSRLFCWLPSCYLIAVTYLWVTWFDTIFHYFDTYSAL